MGILWWFALLNACATSQSRVNGPEPVSKYPPGSPSFDVAGAFNAATEQATALSGRMYKALRAVEEFRRSRERERLTVNEVDIENFDIWIRLGARNDCLSLTAARGCFCVSLSPRYAPGEAVAIDRHARIGRPAAYVVRFGSYWVERVVSGNP